MAVRSAGVKDFFRNAAGKLVSKAGKFLPASAIARFKGILSRRAKAQRGAKGKFTTRSKAAAHQTKVKKANREFRARWGAPHGSLTWVQLITKYPQQFDDYIDEFGDIVK